VSSDGGELVDNDNLAARRFGEHLASLSDSEQKRRVNKSVAAFYGSGDSLGSHGERRVRIECRDGTEFVGTVQQDYVDSHGRRTLLVEDGQGNEGTVRPGVRRSVTVHDLDDEGGSA
jgi:ribosomal protein S6E (S10)